MKRILVVSVNWLGDAILITPVFKALKEAFPSSYVCVMAVERVKGVFTGNSYIDEVIVFDERKNQGSLLAKLRFIKSLRRRRIDTVFLVQRSFTRAFICFLAGIKKRVGYMRTKNAFLLTNRIRPPYGLMHRQDYYLYPFEKEGVKIRDRIPQFFIPDEIQKKMIGSLQSIKKKHSYIVGVNPSANWELKRWPLEYFAALTDLLIKDLNCGVIFIGADKEKRITREIMRKMRYEPYDFCGKTNLKELAAVIKNIDLFISNDSGPAHLAASLGINTLVIFGPTSEQITSPRGKFVRIIRKNVGCKIPCYELNCRDNICMREVAVGDVYAEAKDVLI